MPGKVPQQEGRESQASAGSADSQSVKTTEKRVRYTASREVWQKRNNAVPGKVPQQEGRESQASAGSADSQSVKTTEKRVRYTASREVSG
ncbi:MAG: hypothetical protein BRC52_05860 [Cyanobacteria bacterium SW_5_48_44]|nr:MAG: hypothetical protein BRC52_05860 [Cyanobacteria bacterium SW_5_48_44]